MSSEFQNDIARLRLLLEQEYRCVLAGEVVNPETTPNVSLMLHVAKMQMKLQSECEIAEGARVNLELHSRGFHSADAA
jgi:hypothetical protein